MAKLTPAVIMDMDGVIRKLIHGGKSGDKESYIHSREQVEWCDGVDEAFKILFYEMDYDLFIVSNQSGVYRFAGEDSRFDYRNIEGLFQWMGVEIQRMTTGDDSIERDVIKDMIFCPHLPDAGCACRKPKPGMIYYLAVRYRIDLSKSWMIGDSESDIKAGKNAGIRSRLIMIDSDAPVIEVKEGDIVRLPRKLSEVIRVPSLLNATKIIKAHDIWIDKARGPRKGNNNG